MSIEQLNCDVYVTKQEMEIKRLQKYEKLVRFIANDYYELSYDKAMWQREDWKKRCQKLIEEDND